MNISQFFVLYPNLSDTFNSWSAQDRRDFTIVLYNMSIRSNLSEGFRGFQSSLHFNAKELIDIMDRNQGSSWFDVQTEVPLIVTFAFIMAMSLALNSVVCYVVFRFKRLHTPRNAFIVNLSVSDIMMAATCMPFTLLRLLFKNWTYGLLLCKLVPWMQAVNVFASTLSITAIALDRYHVVLYPAKLAKASKKLKTIGLLTLIWFLSFVAGLPLLIFTRVENKYYMPNVTFKMCLEQWPTVWSRALYAGCIMLFQFLIPIFLLATVHWRICSFFKYRIVRAPSTPFQANRKEDGKRRHRKNAALLLTITVLFAVCWLPLTLINLLADVDYRIFIHQNFLLGYAITNLLAMASACFNPIIYGWFNPNFRRYITNVLLCRGTQEDECCQPQARQTTTTTTPINLTTTTTTRPVCMARIPYHPVNVTIQIQPNSDSNLQLQ